MLVFVRLKPTESAMLEEISSVHLSGRPFQAALNQQDRAAGFKSVCEKLFVRCRKPAELDPKVSHCLNHQPVLIGIVHVVELQFRIATEQFLS